MNRALVPHNLAEAHEALGRVLAEARAHPEWGNGELFAGMPHLYHYLNTAWNARNSPTAEPDALREAPRPPSFPRGPSMLPRGAG